MLTEKISKERCVDKSKVFLMLYKDARPLYDALSAEEIAKWVEKAEAAKVKFQAEQKERKLKN